MSFGNILTLAMGCWAIFVLAYITAPVDPSINKEYLKARQELERIERVAPELEGLEVKMVDDVVTLPLDLGPTDIPQAELRLAAQEITADEWFYIQLSPYPLRPERQEAFRKANSLRPHDPAVMDKQTKRAWRSAVKKRSPRRAKRARNRSKTPVTRRVRKTSSRSRRVRRNRQVLRNTGLVASFRKRSNTTNGYKKELTLAFRGNVR